jgi:hypothetical protein
MARHNREARGLDQSGEEYRVGYQPDWLHQVKVTRTLESGRQSTKTLFRNSSPPAGAPGEKVRTRIESPAQRLTFEITIDDPAGVVRRAIVETVLPDGGAAEPEAVGFIIDHRSAGGGDDD